MSRRRLGQHFLTDLSVIRRIVAAAELSSKDRVFEIGPGKGAITFPLLNQGVPVTSLEFDEGLATALKQDAPESLNVIYGDALVANFAESVGDGSRDSNVLVANLPYRITGALMERILDADCWDRAVLMVQREVGRRLAAEVGSKDYGILTVAANLKAEVEYLFSVPGGCFDPPPKVVSAVVRLRFKSQVPQVKDEKLFFRVVCGAFQQRRKMLRNGLSGVFAGQTEAILTRAGIEPTLRPESVSVDGFERLCRAYDEIAGRLDG